MLTVSEWADSYRRLSSEASAEPGAWTTSRAEYQRGIMDAISDPDVDTVVVMSSAQVGKALAIDTPIATPSGWSTMGALRAGDMVFGSDGKPTKVTGVSPTMCGRDCFRVVFSDGSDVVADADHLWRIESDTVLVVGRPWGGRGTRSGVLTTREILRSLKYGARQARNRYAIPVAPALNLPPVRLPIDPYVLGAWLGDGHSASARLFCHRDDSPHFANEVEKAGYRAEIVKDGACDAVRVDPKKANVCPRGHLKDVTGWSGRGCAECARLAAKNAGRRSRGKREDIAGPIVQTFSRLLVSTGLLNNKHIPAEYLRASGRQRLSLLQGLMDTDGTIGANGRCEFTTTSPAIAAGAADLLASLGIKFTKVIKATSTKYPGKRVTGADAFRFSFLAYSDRPVFRLERKRRRQKTADGGRPTETNRRRIVSVDRVESVPVRCIQVAAEDHLFLAGRAMVPTHNTEIVNNIVGFHIAQDPAPILVVMPTLEMGEAWSKDRLAPMLRDTPALHAKVKDPRARDSGNTLLAKVFPGGRLSICGANSPSSLSARPIRIVLCDEVDRYPPSAGTEGDPVTLAKKRSTTFWNRKLVLTSTPTVKGFSRIEAAFEESDQRRFYVPCPHCGDEQVLRWTNVKWPPNQPEKAAYHCGECGTEWSDVQRWAAIRRGEWRAEASFTGVAGFHLSELYSSWSRIADIARAFLDAKRSPESLKAFINTSLGETWEDQGETVDGHGLQDRVEHWGDKLPAAVLLLTAGVDVQADRLEIEIVGWGRDEESWSVSHKRIFGDPSAPGVWGELDEHIAQTFTREDGIELPVRVVAVDSGYATQSVYRYCRERYSRRVFAIKGASGSGRPIWPKRPTRTSKVSLFPVGVDAAKDALYARLRITRPGPGFCHFPEGRETDWFEQLTAESVVTKYSKGFPTRVWTKKSGARNEALDCRCYAYAALQSLAVVWSRFKDVAKPAPMPASVGPTVDSPPVLPPRQATVARPPRRGSSWATGWAR